MEEAALEMVIGVCTATWKFVVTRNKFSVNVNVYFYLLGKESTLDGCRK
jgi:hypothetical protein